MKRNSLFSPFILIAVAWLFFSGIGIAQPEPPGPVKCLWVGKASHNEPVMDDVLRDIGENYPSVAVTVTENIEDLNLDNLKKYDVLFLLQIKAEKGDPPEAMKQGIVDFLKGGGGLVVTHFAVANVQQWRDSIDIFGAMWVDGKSTHNPYHEFRVDITDETHPIVEGVRPFLTHDELYFNLLMRPAIPSRSLCWLRITTTTPVACISPWVTMSNPRNRPSSGKSLYSPSSGRHAGVNKSHNQGSAFSEVGRGQDTAASGNTQAFPVGINDRRYQALYRALCRQRRRLL